MYAVLVMIVLTVATTGCTTKRTLTPAGYPSERHFRVIGPFGANPYGVFEELERVVSAQGLRRQSPPRALLQNFTSTDGPPVRVHAEPLLHDTVSVGVYGGSPGTASRVSAVTDALEQELSINY